MSKYRIKLNGTIYELEIEKVEQEQLNDKKSPVLQQSWNGPATSKLSARAINPGAEKKTENNNHFVTSPMQGTVIRLLCQAGDMVKQGQTIAVLEAMKMENEIEATKDGYIKEVFVKEGSSVLGGAVLFEIGE